MLLLRLRTATTRGGCMGLFSRARKGSPEEREAARELRSMAYMVQSVFKGAISEQKRSEVVLMLGVGLGEFVVTVENCMETLEALPPSEFRDQAMEDAMTKLAELDTLAIAIAAKKGIPEDEIHTVAREEAEDYRRRLGRGSQDPR